MIQRLGEAEQTPGKGNHVQLARNPPTACNADYGRSDFVETDSRSASRIPLLGKKRHNPLLTSMWLEGAEGEITEGVVQRGHCGIYDAWGQAVSGFVRLSDTMRIRLSIRA